MTTFTTFSLKKKVSAKIMTTFTTFSFFTLPRLNIEKNIMKNTDTFTGKYI